MDSQLVTVDQLASAIASVQDPIANLGQRIDGQQARQAPTQEDAQFDPVPPPPPINRLLNHLFRLFSIIRQKLLHLLP